MSDEPLHGLVRLDVQGAPLPYIVDHPSGTCVGFAIGINSPEGEEPPKEIVTVKWPGSLDHECHGDRRTGLVLAAYLYLSEVIERLDSGTLKDRIWNLVCHPIDLCRLIGYEPDPTYGLDYLCESLEQAVSAYRPT